ncbi:MAG TPA: acetate kinase [Chromobacteriaceae bacterium]|nr:acetate kinase [Chromobacteriaceae bacterium]
MNSTILVINCGSSSLKFAVIDTRTHAVSISGLAEKLGMDGGCVTFKFNDEKSTLKLTESSHAAAMSSIIDKLKAVHLLETIRAVGHRVVHGGEQFRTSAIITESVLNSIEACSKLAPLHNPAALLGIRVAQEHFPDLVHTAVFDTAFHQTMPEHAYYYAIPREIYRENGVRRYGFHGTSYRYVAQQAANMLGKPLSVVHLVCAHLGNGASLCAVRNGISVDTTMGMTPLEGLVMGTRSGDVDPGLYGHLANERGMTALEINDMLNKRSGLLGLSGLSSDCRVLQEAAEQGHNGARIALEKFCYRLAKYIAGQMVAVGRVDGLVFTGGIGENSVWVRSRAIMWLEHFGYKLNDEANREFVGGKQGFINADGSIPIMVVPTNEELMIALDTAQLAKLEC